jgi:hypothetical protein
MPPEDQEPTSAPEANEKDLEIARLRDRVDKLLTEKKALKGMVEAPEGVTAEEVAKLKAFQRQVELERKEQKGAYDDAKKALTEQYERDTTALKEQVKQLQAKVRDLELVAPAASVLSQVVHDPDDVFKTGRLKPDQIEAGPDGPVVVDGLNRTPLADWAKASLPAHYLKAPKPVGSGAPAGGSGGGLPVGSNVKNPFTAPHFSLAEQGRLLRSNPALYAQLKAAAGYPG